MNLYTLFIGYEFGGYSCGVHTSLDNVYSAISELMDECQIDDEMPEIDDSVRDGLDFFHEFDNGTWIHVQRVDAAQTKSIADAIFDSKDAVKIYSDEVANNGWQDMPCLKCRASDDERRKCFFVCDTWCEFEKQAKKNDDYGCNQLGLAAQKEHPCAGCEDGTCDGERCVNEDRCVAWLVYQSLA